MSFGPPIEILPDWNSRLDACGCCPIPELGPPLYARKIATCSANYTGGWIDPEVGNGTSYRTKLTTETAEWTRNDTDPGTCGSQYAERSFYGNKTVQISYDQNYSHTCPCGESSEPTATYTYGGTGTYTVEGYRNWCLTCSGVTTTGTENNYSESRSYSYNPDFYGPGSGSYQDEWTETSRSWYRTCSETTGPTETVDSGTSATSGTLVPPSGGYASGEYTSEDTYSDGETYESWISSKTAILNTAAAALSDGCYSNETSTTPLGSKMDITVSSPPGFYGGGSGPSILARSVRYRWFVPESSIPVSPQIQFRFIQITWDLAFFPEDGGSPTIVDTDLTQDLTVASPGDPPPDTWTFRSSGSPVTRDGWFVGSWLTLPIPEYEGIIRPVNIRYSYFSAGTPWGDKPMITGDAVPVP